MVIHFPVADIDLFPLWPFLTAFVIALFSSTAGVTGAFLLLPFQVSVLGFQGPSVSATNHLFNVIGSPGGVFRYFREGRLPMPLALVLIAGTAPGIIGGVFIRIVLLPEAGAFKLFVGCVLLLLGVQILLRLLTASGERTHPKDRNATVTVTSFDPRRIGFSFQNENFSVNVPLVFAFSLLVGLVGGAYGIGGGALTSAFLVGVCRLPVHLTAGATLLATFVSSSIAVVGYVFLAPLFSLQGSASPDWLLGALFGAGGLAGTYLGSRLQKFIPGLWIRLFLALLMLALAGKYILGFIAQLSP